MKARKVLTMDGGVPLYVHHPEAVHEGPASVRAAVRDETDKISKYIREMMGNNSWNHHGKPRPCRYHR